jgi:rare lipoprotein A
MFRKIFLTVTAFILLSWSQAAYAVFSDVASNNPHYEAINYLQENGIIEGYPDNTFRPGQSVNRAEALKIILLGSDIFVPEIQDQKIFPDVVYGTWYAKYVTKAKNLGVVSGDSDTGLFRPGDTVNLAEILKILVETKQAETSLPDSNPYPDVPADSWFAPYFEYAKSVSLLDESESENVYPATPVNRGLMAELMYRLAKRPNGYQEGKASYYGSDFHGETTASGEVFDASAFTAAHRTFPFNTWLLVTNPENGKSVTVRVNDRGPYSGDRIIDLSKAAFEAIASLSRGVIDVSVRPASAPSGSGTNLGANLLDAAKCSEKSNLRYLSKTSYDNITLNNEIPNRLAEGEVLSLSGHTTSSASKVSAFIVDENSNQYSFYGPTENGNFKFNVYFPKTGTFDLGLLPGESGNSVIQEIKILPKECITESEDASLPSPTGISIGRSNGDTVIKWNKGDYQLFRIKFTQGGKSNIYYLYDSGELIPYYRDFEGFDDGTVEVSVQGAHLLSKSLMESSDITWSANAAKSFKALGHFEYIINGDQIEIVSSPESITPNKAFGVTAIPKVSLNSKAAIILPSGETEEIPLESDIHEPITNVNGIEIFAPSDDALTLNYKPANAGLYFLEINNANGLAALNIPLYPADEYPLIPNPVELYNFKTVDLGSNMTALRDQMLGLVNEDRADHQKSPVKLDSALNSLAQFRADDMITNNYFSHWDQQGRNANDIRKNYAISQVVTENIAKDINMELAEYGLMRSALHRSNILNNERTRLGVGLARDTDGGYVFVQIFSADPINMEEVDLLRGDVLDAINENRSTDLALQSNLNTLAQSWSEKMANEDFFDFTASDSSTLVGNIRAAGIKASLGTYLIGNTSFQAALGQVAGNAQIAESNWANLGIGIKQDSLGIIKITLIYTE